jgi:hypothetical protein
MQPVRVCSDNQWKLNKKQGFLCIHADVSRGWNSFSNTLFRQFPNVSRCNNAFPHNGWRLVRFWPAKNDPKQTNATRRIALSLNLDDLHPIRALAHRIARRFAQLSACLIDPIDRQPI